MSRRRRFKVGDRVVHQWSIWHEPASLCFRAGTVVWVAPGVATVGGPFYRITYDINGPDYYYTAKQRDLFPIEEMARRVRELEEKRRVEDAAQRLGARPRT